MEYLPPILFLLLIFSLLFNHLSLSYKRTSFEIVKDMGIGYNLEIPSIVMTFLMILKLLMNKQPYGVILFQQNK